MLRLLNKIELLVNILLLLHFFINLDDPKCLTNKTAINKAGIYALYTSDGEWQMFPQIDQKAKCKPVVGRTKRSTSKHMGWGED